MAKRWCRFSILVYSNKGSSAHLNMMEFWSGKRASLWKPLTSRRGQRHVLRALFCLNDVDRINMIQWVEWTRCLSDMLSHIQGCVMLCSFYVILGFFASCLRFAQRFSVFRPDFWIWEVTVGPFRRCTIHFQCLHFHPTNFWCEINVINVVIVMFCIIFHWRAWNLQLVSTAETQLELLMRAVAIAGKHSPRGVKIMLRQMSTRQEKTDFLPVGFRFLQRCYVWCLYVSQCFLQYSWEESWWKHETSCGECLSFRPQAAWS